MRYRSKASVRHMGVLLALTAIGALPLLAQKPAAAPSSDDNTIFELPPVEVTATLRSEPLLSIPVSVAVMSGTQMLAANMANLSDVTMQMPSFTYRFQGSAKDQAMLIRGLGTITTSPGTEPDVSTVVDSVVLARPGQAFMSLIDVDHIEVLKGPQGTLFGKNASVGVVNIVTKDPTEKPEGYLDVRYLGSGNEEDVRAGVSGAIIPGKLNGMLSVMYGTYDGNVQNITLNKTVTGVSNYGTRGKLVFKPNDNFKATFILSYVHSYITPPLVAMATATTNFPAGVTSSFPVMAQAILPVVASTNNLQTGSGYYAHDYDDNATLSGQFEWKIGEFTLTAISAYQHWFNKQLQDQGNVPVAIYLPGTTNTYTSWDHGWLMFDAYSQELRITSPKGHLFEYVGGLFWEKAIDTETYRRDVTQAPDATTKVANFGEAHYGTVNNTVAAYGEGTWNISKQFRVVTGLRVTHDTLSFYHQRVASSPVAVPGVQPTLGIHSGDTSANGVSGRGGLQYDLAKNTMVYVTYTKGYKGPAYNVFFNQTILQVGALQPEVSDDYEVGIKTMALSNRLQFTGTVFDTKYKNYQANFQTYVLGTAVTNLINAGQVSTKGIEFDSRYLVTPDFTLYSSAAWINAKIDNFFTPAGAANVNGQPLPFSPTFKGNVMGTYTIAMSNGYKVLVSSDYTYLTKQQFSLTETPDTVQPAYGIWNASVALVNPASGWKVTLFAKNIADQHYALIISQGTNALVRMVPRDNSRYFGIAIHKDFY